MNARQKINKLIIDHQKEFGFHSNFDFMNELLAEMEEDRTEYAHKAIEAAAEAATENGNHSTASDILKLREKY